MNDTLINGVTSSIAYFALAAVVLVLSFILLDLLTPGRLRDLVFIHHLPNAAAVVVSQQIAVTTVLVTAVLTSSESLGEGLIETAVFALTGVVIQTIVLVLVEALVPGRFRDLVRDPKLRAGSVVVGVLLVITGVLNAACLA